jgi:hypothetical protein
VIKKLLNYITIEAVGDHMICTKPMELLKNAIDPTPVVRSFLLQMLLRSK